MATPASTCTTMSVQLDAEMQSAQKWSASTAPRSEGWGMEHSCWQPSMWSGGGMRSTGSCGSFRAWGVTASERPAAVQTELAVRQLPEQLADLMSAVGSPLSVHSCRAGGFG